MKEITIPIDQAGRLVLPRNVRRELAIEAGDTLKVSIHGATVVLTPNKDSAGFVRKGKALIFTTGDDQTLSNDEVSGVLAASRNERDDTNLAFSRGKKRRA